MFVLLIQVWDVNLIETAMKNFYRRDVNVMVDSIERNITVSAKSLVNFKLCEIWRVLFQFSIV